MGSIGNGAVASFRIPDRTNVAPCGAWWSGGRGLQKNPYVRTDDAVLSIIIIPNRQRESRGLDPILLPVESAFVNDSSVVGGGDAAGPSAVVPATGAAVREERFNAATHAIGLVLACVGAVAVIGRAARQGAPWQIAACSFYAVTLVAAYAASTLSHVFPDGRTRRAFRIADQAVIFLFIAGSYAPLAAAWLRGDHWWVLHAAIFGVALLGFVSKAAFAHRVEVGTVSAALYLLLGWSPLFAARPIVAAMPEALSFSLLLGGICYTVGLVFFSYDRRVRYFHAAWHVMVIAGSACHYYGILHYCTGR